MMAMITIPAELYQQIASYAQKRGQQPDEVVVGWLDEKVQQVAEPKILVEGYDPAADPLSQFAGIGASGHSDWIENHDKYLAQLAYGDKTDAKDE